MTTVVLADSDFADLELEERELAEAGLELVISASPAAADIASAASDAEGLLLQWARADSGLLDLLPELRVIGRYGTGVDVIDVDEATRRGVAVVNSGHYATEEVTAHAIALTLSLLRRVCALDRAIRRGSWEPLAGVAGMKRLSAVRVGVVGLGHIGQRVARQLQALGLDVAGYDAIATPEGIACAATLGDLLSRSDLVTLHVPLSASTDRLIDAEALELLPTGSMLVNTSRGAVIDQKALVAALQSGRLGGAALDVFEAEPLPQESPLLQLDNVILTPHVAYYSEEALLEARLRTVRALVAVLSGSQPADLVNPAYLKIASP